MTRLAWENDENDLCPSLPPPLEKSPQNNLHAGCLIFIKGKNWVQAEYVLYLQWYSTLFLRGKRGRIWALSKCSALCWNFQSPPYGWSLCQFIMPNLGKIRSVLRTKTGASLAGNAFPSIWLQLWYTWGQVPLRWRCSSFHPLAGLSRHQTGESSAFYFGGPR